MVSYIQLVVKGGDVVNNLYFVRDNDSYIILKVRHFVSPSSDHSGCVEELNIRIPIREPVYSGSNHL